MFFRSEYSSVWKCGQASLGYFVTQLAKLLLLASFFPTSEHEGGRFDFFVVRNLFLSLLKQQNMQLDTSFELLISRFVLTPFNDSLYISVFMMICDECEFKPHGKRLKYNKYVVLNKV